MNAAADSTSGLGSRLNPFIATYLVDQTFGRQKSAGLDKFDLGLMLSHYANFSIQTLDQCEDVTLERQRSTR